MSRPARRQRGLRALAAAAKGILELIQQPDADPIEINERATSLLLLLHPVAPALRDAKRRNAALERLMTMVMRRWQDAEAAWSSLTSEERAAISDGHS